MANYVCNEWHLCSFSFYFILFKHSVFLRWSESTFIYRMISYWLNWYTENVIIDFCLKDSSFFWCEHWLIKLKAYSSFLIDGLKCYLRISWKYNWFVIFYKLQVFLSFLNFFFWNSRDDISGPSSIKFLFSQLFIFFCSRSIFDFFIPYFDW